MPHLTMTDLQRLLVASAGAPEGVAPGADISDVPFEDLGYDSLALIETVTKMSREVGVAVDHTDLIAVPTPRQFLAGVNAQLQVGAR
jgi:act minimal PKS acyl carrier protein